MTHSPKLISERKRKKKKTEREENLRRGRTYCPCQEREREIKRDRACIDVNGACRSARSSFGKGQGAAATAAGRGQREGGLRT